VQELLVASNSFNEASVLFDIRLNGKA